MYIRQQPGFWAGVSDGMKQGAAGIDPAMPQMIALPLQSKAIICGFVPLLTLVWVCLLTQSVNALTVSSPLLYEASQRWCCLHAVAEELMRLHAVFGLMMMFWLAGARSIVHPDRAQASNQLTFKTCVVCTHAYQPPKTGLHDRREGAGTR